MRRIFTFVATSFAFLIVAAAVAAQETSRHDIEDEVQQSQKAARVFHEIMNAPDHAIPRAILDDARCVAVFPEVVEAAFGIGGRGGRGVASCRTQRGWSSPAYFGLGGGSFGWQIGVEVIDFVILFMTDEGMNSLLSSKVTLGAGASVAAGPVGRQAGGATDAKLNGSLCRSGAERHGHRVER